MDGVARGAETVRSILVTAREQYEHQEFKFAGPVGDYGFLADYTSRVRGEYTAVIVLVTFNAAGQTQRVVVNHRPRSALLSFSRLMLEKFAGTPAAKHWEGTPSGAQGFGRRGTQTQVANLPRRYAVTFAASAASLASSSLAAPSSAGLFSTTISDDGLT